MKKLIFFSIILFTVQMFSQNTLFLVDSSASYSTNSNIEYNTGEIFVIYNFNGNLYNKEKTDVKDNFVPNQALLSEEKSGIIVFPNPTQNGLNYKIKDNFQFINARVYDHNQKLLFTIIENTGQIDLTNFPVGLYNIIFNDNPENGFKIIKI